MAATNFTPISIYYSATASNVPVNTNLVAGELAINTNDGKLFYKDSSGVVQVLATKATTAGTFTTVTTTTLTSPSATALTIQSAGTTAITVDTSQNVGIGTSSPDVYSLGIPTLTLYNASSTPAVTVAGSTAGYINLGSTTVRGATIGGGTNYLAFFTNSTGTGTGVTERMRIDTSGNVGIGTSSPTTLGAGYPTLDIRGSTGGALRLGNATDSAYIYSNSSETNIATATAKPLLFSTNTVERMRIDTSGYLLINETAATGTPATGVVIAPGSNAGGAAIYIGHKNGTGSTNSYATFAYNGGSIGSITQSGTTAVLYNTTSDYRLKNNVLPIQNALATVKKLNPVSFTWIDGRPDDGFIAHEIQTVIPNCVTGEKDAVNENGAPKYQQMDNSGVIPFLVKAIQEQQALIESLTTRLTALESK